MDSSASTCWTVIQDAAQGDRQSRELFASRYAPAIRAYLAARWSRTALETEVEDAQQEVFVECFTAGGVLEKADPGRPGGFRAFLYGVTRNVALRCETRRQRRDAGQGGSGFDFEELAGGQESLSRVFDRAWAEGVIREAGRIHRERASRGDDGQRRRVELLDLRFREGLPIREIAQRWQEDPARLHHEYARARAEFREALMEVMRFYHPQASAAAEQECAHLLALLD